MAKGDVIVVRYADDLVVGFQHRTDAERFLREFRERLAKFGLELHPDKTRLIEFGRFAARDRKQRGEGKPETFTFLGFTHYCGRRHKSGTFTVWRITAKKRMVVMLKSAKNPGGLPIEVFDELRQKTATTRAQFYQDLTLPFYDFNGPGALISQGVRELVAPGNDGRAASRPNMIALKHSPRPTSPRTSRPSICPPGHAR